MMHTPFHITKVAVKAAQDLQADSIASIGGGSTIGLGKAVSVRSDLPHICVPTTYAGSGMTPILGETTDDTKTTQKDVALLPVAVFYDISLTMSLPAEISLTNGIDAVAHTVEALYAPNTNLILRLQAREGMGALSQALLMIVNSLQDLEARTKALYGA